MAISPAAKLYYGRLYQGLCPLCGGARDNGWITCQTCQARNRGNQASIPRKVKTRYNKKYRKRNRRRGLCPLCGREPVPGRVHCQACLDRFNIRNERRKNVKVNCS